MQECVDCGKKKAPKYFPVCKPCQAKRLDVRRANATELLKKGVCPECGTKLRYNSSITGWWQCAQLGAEGFRLDASKPSCGFQFFAE